MTVNQPSERYRTNDSSNSLAPEDRAAHDWYRFVLSYPAHLVREYIERFGLSEGAVVLDPFCGTGTTLVECKKRGIAGVGIEANPIAHFASQTKVNWSPDPETLIRHARDIASAACAELDAQGLSDHQSPEMENTSNGLSAAQPLRDFPDKVWKVLPKDAISPVPLHRLLTLREYLANNRERALDAHERLALAKIAVYTASNLRFGPEVGLGPIKNDAPVVSAWLDALEQIAGDLHELKSHAPADATVYLADARRMPEAIPSTSIDAVITSPPYPNEKDYTRITRLESVLLGFYEDRAGLRAFKHSLIRSNTRNVYKGDSDDLWIEHHAAIRAIADAIEARRIEMGKTSGFERLYAKVTTLYFGGMARHLAELRRVLRPGAQLAYVVGDQASYLRIMIRTGQLLAQIAESLGYEVVGIDLFRTRLATATREQLREEVVVLRWPGER